MNPLDTIITAPDKSGERGQHVYLVAHHTPTHFIVLGTHESQDTHVNKSYRTAMTPAQPAKPKHTKNVKQGFVDIVVEHGYTSISRTKPA